MERKMSSDKGVPLQSSETIRLNPRFYRWMDGRGGGWDGRGSSPLLWKGEGKREIPRGILAALHLTDATTLAKTRDLSSDPWQ